MKLMKGRVIVLFFAYIFGLFLMIGFFSIVDDAKVPYLDRI